MRLKLKQKLTVFRRASGISGNRRKVILASLVTVLVSYVTARAEVFVSRYVVSLDGLRVGDATLRTDLDTKRYKLGVSADVGLFLVSTQIQAEASGTRTGLNLTPEHFQITVSGSDEEVIEYDFANSPEAAANGAVRLRGVFDPLSALLVASLKPLSASNHLCDTVLPIFTGRDRFDLHLRPKATGPVQGEPILCDATLSQPLTGGGKRHLDWEIAFMKAATPPFWTVEHISFPTANGLVKIARAEPSSSRP